MLGQSQVDNGIIVILPVVYASRTLSEAGRNYGVVDNNGLVVSWAITHLRLMSTGNTYVSLRTTLH